jgi:uncharacterized membrane protein YhaH (DUF805 family)
MGSFSIFHWLFLVIVIVLLLVPYWKIFPRAGWSSWMSLLMLVPVVNFILLYVLAFKKWPGDA